MSLRIVQPGFIVLSLVLCACSHSEGGSTSGPPVAGLPSADRMSSVPMGHIANLTDSTAPARSIPNPYAGNAQAVEEGRVLYIKMNCAGCHGYDAKGNMGPDLTDTYWRFGGFPAQIYQSIHDGRAQGMPAWGAALPPQEIWKLVAYIQSLGGTFSVDGRPRNAQRTELIAPELRANAADDTKATVSIDLPSVATSQTAAAAPTAPLPAAASSSPVTVPATAASSSQPPAAASSP